MYGIFFLGMAVGTLLTGFLGAFNIYRTDTGTGEARITAMVVMAIVAALACIELLIAYITRGV